MRVPYATAGVLLDRRSLFSAVIAALRTPPVAHTKSGSRMAEKALHRWYPPCAALIATEEMPLGIFKRHANFF